MLPSFPNSFWWRRVVEYLRLLEEQKRQAEWPDFFDNAREKFRNGPGREVWRDVEGVTTVCVHQTGCEFGFSKKLAKVLMLEYGITQEEADRMALHHRFYKTPYHVLALRNGDVLWNNDPRWYTYGGRRCNSFSIHLAIEGLYPSGKNSPWDEFMIATAQDAFTLAVNKSRSLGCNIRAVTAHRVWSGSRLLDPGEAIWHDAIAPKMGELSLIESMAGPDDGGKRIPDGWFGDHRPHIEE